MAATEPDRIDVLDGLRGFAVLLVVLFHVWQISWFDISRLTGRQVNLWWLPKVGFIGVEMFFVLSGFCIAYPFAFAAGKSMGWKEFYRRRALKILPSYWLVILVAGVFFADGPTQGKPLFEWLTHLTLTQNWFFESYYSLLGPAWSLGVEVQFYALFPLILIPLRRWPLVAALGLALIAVFWRRWAWDVSGGDAGFYTMRINQLPGCLDLFACGMLAASAVAGVKKNHAGRRWIAPLSSIVCLTALVALLLLLRGFEHSVSLPLDTPRWQARWRLPIGLLTGLVAAGGALGYPLVGRALAIFPLRFLALISYNLYLWHKPLADFLLKHGVPAASTPDPHDDLLWQGSFAGAAIGLSVLTASLVTFAFERPLLRLGKRRKLGNAENPVR